MSESAYFPATGMPDDDWWRVLWPDPNGVLAKVGISPGMSVIDLCCGNGHFTAPLAALAGKDGRIIAVDMDSKMLGEARLRVDRAGQKQPLAPCEWIEADACHIDQSLKDKNKADALIIANTFHGVPDKTGLSESVVQVLKPGGLFIVINWHARPREQTIVLNQPRGPRTDMRMTPDEVAEVVVPAGFMLTEIVDLPPFHYGAVFLVA